MFFQNLVIFGPEILTKLSISKSPTRKWMSESKSTVKITLFGFFVAPKNLMKFRFCAIFVQFTVDLILKNGHENAEM